MQEIQTIKYISAGSLYNKQVTFELILVVQQLLEHLLDYYFHLSKKL